MSRIEPRKDPLKEIDASDLSKLLDAYVPIDRKLIPEMIEGLPALGENPAPYELAVRRLLKETGVTAAIQTNLRDQFKIPMTEEAIAANLAFRHVEARQNQERQEVWKRNDSDDGESGGELTNRGGEPGPKPAGESGKERSTLAAV